MLTNTITSSLIKEISSLRTYAKGQTILYPEDNGSQLYLIKRGTVMMHDIDNEGNRKVLYIFGPSILFPMVTFMDKKVSTSWFYTAIVDTEVYVVPYESFKKKLQDKDGYRAYNALLRQAMRETHELLRRISDHSKTDSMGKIISILQFLLEYHTKATSKTWRPVAFPVPHQLLADMTGLTRETVTLTMKDLTKKKLIRYPAKSDLELNSANLIKYANDR